MKPSTLVRLATVGLAVTAIAACTPRTPADTGAGNTVPPPANDQYVGNGAGPVSGGNLGAAAPGSEQDFVVNVGDRVFFGYDFSSTTFITSALFSTTIAPIAGAYGPVIGVVAGMLHLTLVTNIGIIHGGINLYNNGFSGGLVAGFLVPIIDAFKRGDTRG